MINCAISTALQSLIIILIRNSTTAKIFPPALKPMNKNGTRIEGKMVDYAICLEFCETEPIYKRMLTALKLEPPENKYINHTFFEPVRFRPIAVSIETKLTANENEAVTQLSVWVVAHFKRLNRILQLAGVGSGLTVLPLIYIQGDEWFATLAAQRYNKTVLSNISLISY